VTARAAVQYIELDINYCSLSYGVGACTAVLGVDSTDKCFNSVATCAKPAVYAASTVTLRFTEENTFRDQSIDALTNLMAVNFSPAQINPGVDLGKRASLRITLQDHPHSDTGAGFDKYQTGRSYNPYEQGTIWGKFRARQPYLRNREVRWYQGYSDQALSEMELRTFIVESFDGPNADGSYTLMAVDPLKMLDGDRAQAPSLSGGRMVADITNVATSLTMTPAGIGATDYPASGYVNLGGDEIASFTRAADVLTITRAQLGSTAGAHTAADRVQLALRYSAADPADILYSLMVTYAEVPAAYINLSEWQAETAGYLKRNYTGTIAEPTPVAKLVAELMAQCGLSIWWDDLAAKIRLRVLRANATNPLTFDDSNILPKTFSRREQPDKRLSQVWVYYGLKDPTKGLEENDNYRSAAITADLAAEGNYGSAAIKKIYSRWIPGGGQSAALRVGTLLIGRYGTPPRLFSFQLMRDAQSMPALGNSHVLQWRTEQTSFGVLESVTGQILKVTPSKDKIAIEVEELRVAAANDTTRQITIDYDDQNLNWRTLHDDLYDPPADGDVVTMIVETSAHVGSASTSLPALDTGTWPTRSQTGNRTSGSPILTSLSVATTGLTAGMRVTGTGIPAGAKILTVDSPTQITLNANATSGAATSTTLTIYTVQLSLIVRGRIQGCGGLGGTGANGNGNIDATDGLAGGLALKVQSAIDLTDASGQIFGGGGGGGGGPCRDPSDHKGGGGGGGAGDSGGLGGEGPGNGREGSPGTREAGGAGGHGWTNNNFFAGPSDDSSRRGGNGGGPGLVGQNGQGSSDLNKGNGGAAGSSIDGISKVLTIGSAGDRRGSQIN